MRGYREHSDKPKKAEIEVHEDELKYILWKAEKHKELLAFWKSISQ